MSAHDVYMVEAETMIGGEMRRFGIQVRARTPRDGSLPAIVNQRGQAFLADVLDGSDVRPSFDGDYPARLAAYTVRRDGRIIVASFTRRPVKPTVG